MADTASRSRIPAAIFLTVITVSILVIALFSDRCSQAKETPTPPADTPENAEASQTSSDTETISLPSTPEDPHSDTVLPDGYDTPSDYVEQLAALLRKEQIDQDQLLAMLAQNGVDTAEKDRLRALIQQNALRLDPNLPTEEIGELDPGKHSRWALNLANQQRLLLDLKRGKDGKWTLDDLTLPDEESSAQSDGLSPLPKVDEDALNCTHQFLQYTISQDFGRAKKLVNALTISDAKIAGLCIIFEEGGYRLRAQKPVRALFHKETAAGFYAHVVSSEGMKAARLSIIVHRKDTNSPWRVQEVNLDQLLSDYAKRIAGGDVHYSPLIKNPKGGDTLVIYFAFDEDGLTQRTKSQLAIVSNLLKLDANKKIHISGHTDGLGTDDYNLELSQRRAKAVRDFLAERGVAEAQINLQAHGRTQPRLPNTRADGTDNPEARRANRRTEIYLDF